MDKCGFEAIAHKAIITCSERRFIPIGAFLITFEAFDLGLKLFNIHEGKLIMRVN